jgi:hypothetical protein
MLFHQTICDARFSISTYDHESSQSNIIKFQAEVEANQNNINTLKTNIQRLEEGVNECYASQCQNGSTCIVDVDNPNGYICLWSGKINNEN